MVSPSYFVYVELLEIHDFVENVHQLSSGSIMDYPGGIENIESITGTPERPKFRSE
jgi:hypothetical protein